MKSSKGPSKIQTPNKLIIFSLVSCLLCMTYFFSSKFIFSSTKLPHFSTNSLSNFSSLTSLEHIVFGIASSERSWSNRKNYVKLWWRPNQMKGCVFLEKLPRNAKSDKLLDAGSLPPVCISGDTSRFRYTFKYGPRSAIRVARVVSETVALNHSNVRWFVFGDDDTVFFPENLVNTLSKYDHGLWYYIGANSESYAQNKDNSHHMAFGGAGFAISYPLAKVFAKVFDSCLDRYAHLYGSDARIHACLTELGVSLTNEPGFHQMDLRGNAFGFLASHPLKPLVSLHHLEAIDPIFPNMTTLESLQHLFQAVSIDSLRTMQQTVCYDRWFSWTISVSWGYAVQVFPQNLLLPDALRTQETYTTWKNHGGMYDFYSFDTMGYHPDPCQRPPIFFLDKVFSEGEGIIRSTYRRRTFDNCTFDTASPRKLEEIRVLSHKQELGLKQLQAPRRQCCDALPSSGGNVMEVKIRECMDDELIYIHP